MRGTLMQSQRGAALVVCILVLIVLSLIGSAAILGTSTDNKITHVYRKSGVAFFAADGGAEQALGIVNYFIYETPEAGDTTHWRSDVKTVVDDNYFVYEIMGIADADHNDGATDIPHCGSAPDITTTVGDNTTMVDVDRMNKDYAVGGNVEWGSEGGMSLGAGEGVAIFYRIDSRGQYSDSNTATNVETLYRHLL